MHQAELLRQQRREEQEALKKKRQFTWNQKVGGWCGWCTGHIGRRAHAFCRPCLWTLPLLHDCNHAQRPAGGLQTCCSDLLDLPALWLLLLRLAAGEADAGRGQGQPCPARVTTIPSSALADSIAGEVEAGRGQGQPCPARVVILNNTALADSVAGEAEAGRGQGVPGRQLR